MTLYSTPVSITLQTCNFPKYNLKKLNKQNESFYKIRPVLEKEHFGPTVSWSTSAMSPRLERWKNQWNVNVHWLFQWCREWSFSKDMEIDWITKVLVKIAEPYYLPEEFHDVRFISSCMQYWCLILNRFLKVQHIKEGMLTDLWNTTGFRREQDHGLFLFQ